MNALESASLVMIPSGYEDGTLGSLKPTDGTGDFTFSRGSNISATRVNADGYIEKGYENLLLQSNSFTTTWLSVNADTPTDGYEGYDGSNDAWLLNSTGTDGRVTQSVSQTGVQSFSVYAKANTNNWICLISLTTPIVRANFDLNPSTTGSRIGVTGNDIDANIEDVGNGWFRCSVTYNATITGVNIYSLVDDNVFTGTGSIYIQDAMLNQGLVSYPYVETTTAPVAGGILEDMPRLDYSNGSCPSLLLEPSRTNSVDKSEYGFVTNNTSIEYNNAISPEGYQNAFKSTATGTSAVFTRIADISGGVTNPLVSVFVKYGNNAWLNIIYSGSADTYFNFNCQTGEFGTSVGSLTSNLKAENYGNGWWRVSARFNYSGAGSLRVYMASSGTTGFATGSTTIGNYFYGYGFQLEQDATYPTSYIPTYGVSQTRLGDVCDRGSNLAYTGNYTLFMEFELTKDGLYLLNSNNSTAYNFFIENDDCYFQFGRTGGGSGSVSFVNMFDWRAALGTTIKMAFYKSGTNAKLFVNGTPYTPSGNTLSTGNEVLDWRYLNYTTTPNRQHQSYIKQLVEFETALSDEACIELTTI